MSHTRTIVVWLAIATARGSKSEAGRRRTLLYPAVRWSAASGRLPHLLHVSMVGEIDLVRVPKQRSMTCLRSSEHVLSWARLRHLEQRPLPPLAPVWNLTGLEGLCENRYEGLMRTQLQP